MDLVPAPASWPPLAVTLPRTSHRRARHSAANMLVLAPSIMGRHGVQKVYMPFSNSARWGLIFRTPDMIMTRENVVFMNPILLGICYLNIGFFSTSLLCHNHSLQVSWKMWTVLIQGKHGAGCSSVHILWAVTRILGAEAFLRQNMMRAWIGIESPLNSEWWLFKYP